MKVPAWRQFSRHPYPVEIVAVVTSKQWQALADLWPALKKEADPFKQEGSGLTTFVKEPGIMPLVVVSLSASTAATASHEAVHVVQYVEQTINERLDDETAAYMVGALTGWLLDVLSRSGRTVTAS